jgi:hypothetical protein
MADQSNPAGGHNEVPPWRVGSPLRSEIVRRAQS